MAPNGSISELLLLSEDVELMMLVLVLMRVCGGRALAAATSVVATDCDMLLLLLGSVVLDEMRN